MRYPNETPHKLNPLPPGCETLCTGCKHRHFSFKESLDQKNSFLKKILNPWVYVLTPIQTISNDKLYHYREKICLKANWSINEGWQFGFLLKNKNFF